EVHDAPRSASSSDHALAADGEGGDDQAVLPDAEPVQVPGVLAAAEDPARLDLSGHGGADDLVRPGGDEVDAAAEPADVVDVADLGADVQPGRSPGADRVDDAVTAVLERAKEEVPLEPDPGGAEAVDRRQPARAVRAGARHVEQS